MRKSKITRKTYETNIKLNLNIDGKGKSKIKTPVYFLNHMLELFAKHGFFDLEIEAEGDVQVDFHHTTEDIGIVLGQAFDKALLDRKKIIRYGFFLLPMDETLCEVALDISGRPFLTCNFPEKIEAEGEFSISLVKEFFRAFVNNAKITLHINVKYGENAHHIIEAVFKAVSKALSSACVVDDKIEGVLSSKGVI